MHDSLLYSLFQAPRYTICTSDKQQVGGGRRYTHTNAGGQGTRDGTPRGRREEEVEEGRRRRRNLAGMFLLRHESS